MKRIISPVLILSCFLGSFFSFIPARAAGATLFLSPASGSYAVGKNFVVKVMINSGGGQGINAAESTIKYDAEKLAVASVSESGSIFELWTTKPANNGAQGTITFGGGLPSSYTGSAGLIFTINFTAKKAGAAKVDFSSGVVLAADGKGTNIFSGFGNGTYTIEEAKKEEVVKPKPEEPKKEEVKGVLPPLPEINSATHPVEEQWYADNQPALAWKLLSDITGISYGITKQAEDAPDNISEGIVEGKKYETLPDGEQFFHIKYQNKVGWGKTSHYRLLIDTEAPELSNVRLDFEGDETNPRPVIKFNATDKTSGIDIFTIKLNGLPQEVKKENLAQGEYRLEVLAPGEYDLEFTVADKAKNSSSAVLKFAISPLKAPIITDIPKEITTRDELIIRGTSFYPQVTIKIFLAKNSGEPLESIIKTDDQGSWNYFHRQALSKGIYEVWAQVIDSRGAKSSPSVKYILTVKRPTLIEAYGWLIILILLAVIVILIFFIFYQRQKYRQERARLKKEVTDVKNRLAEIFTALREEVDEIMDMADKRPGLSESERRVKEKLQEALNISQEFLDKEVEDVDREINAPVEKITPK
ncbi:hypothetical protein COX69_02945 [Candidatus Falkowbacteria bacterium CG_4_10_14_0_2_um_filter_48_10]|uniref:Cohesin domain-containing protein n=1 Tax=Candidatus Falkowbacteria bacterium CG23_combo_of_CG06-09_8_20_14_all_49_15 TaxID=1974572 RepID=A0A2G9ZLJ2_9BACT|nr:MAG: hypothetical protein COX22_01485 [Candidatus Falkowbacteria bacterium CG23_combo_of_CG06-09_8_20_14_all_49_15]PJA08181.1 MAG: hypothetical protein COX69_02945 [Candidatus Falkowbacteria bacterium CG_4_10_14_0_2_um_filter_48_10]